MELNGCLDRCDSKLVAGWAMYPRKPDRRATIDVYTGARFLGRCLADQYRRDLDEAGLLGGCCSFNFEPPADLSEAEIQAIRAIIVESGYMFACGVPEPMLDVEIDDIYRLDDIADNGTVRRFKKCILHIGCEKTGSTTIQKFLHCNRDELGRAGYFVPLSLAPAPGEFGINHSYLPTLAMDDHGFEDDLRVAAAIPDAPTLLAYRRTQFKNFRDELRHAPATADTLILSSEHCHSRLASVQSIRHLKKFLAYFSENFKILVYLRPQHEVAISRYGMFLLAGLSNIDMFPPRALPPGYDKVVNTPSGYFDYATLLERWAHIFGDAAVEPRLFDRAMPKNADLIDDFIAACHLPRGVLAKPPAQNTNVSAAAQSFLVRLHAGGAAAALPPATIQMFAALLRTRFPGNGMLPSGQDAAAFFAQFASANEAVRARWFPQRQSLFACDFSAYPVAQMPPSRQDDGIFESLLLEAATSGQSLPPAPPDMSKAASSLLRHITRRRPPLPAMP